MMAKTGISIVVIMEAIIRMSFTLQKKLNQRFSLFQTITSSQKWKVRISYWRSPGGRKNLFLVQPKTFLNDDGEILGSLIGRIDIERWK
jgi:peptidyl-tRNA hydrolase